MAVPDFGLKSLFSLIRCRCQLMEDATTGEACWPSRSHSSDNLRHELVAIGYDLGEALSNLGRIVVLVDALGGPLLHEQAGVAVLVTCGTHPQIALARREAGTWRIVCAASIRSSDEDLQDIMTRNCGEYYRQLEHYFADVSAATAAA